MTSSETHRPCIRFSYFGGSNEVDFSEFAYDVVQDVEIALEYAWRLLDGEREIEVNADQDAKYYQLYELLDAEALRNQANDYGDEVIG